jgi:hypothetical protein
MVTIPPSYLNTTISLGNSHSIRSFSQRVPQLSHNSGCDSGGAQGMMPKTKKERHKNVFMSIFPEPDA